MRRRTPPLFEEWDVINMQTQNERRIEVKKLYDQTKDILLVMHRFGYASIHTTFKAIGEKKNV